MVDQKVIYGVLILLIVIAGVGGYYAGLQQIPPTEGATTTITETKTITTTKTITQTGTPTTTTQPPEYVTEELTIGTTDKVTDLDPANAYDFFTWEILNNVMDGLVQYEPGTDHLVPALAKDWEVKEDGKVWIFHLRKDAKFCDGTPVTAHDVVRSINRVFTIQGDPSWLVTEFVEDVTALDDYTVQFTLSKPVSYFLALLATPPYFPVHPNYPDANISSDATWGGAGHYCITDFKRDQYIVLEANPYYYGDHPKTHKIVVRFYKDASTLRLAFENKEVDIAWRTLRPTDYQDLKNNPDYKLIEIPSSYIRYLVINVQMEPTNNKLVRQAIAAAIDRQELAEVVFLGTMEPLYSLVPKGLWSHIDIFQEKYGDGNISLAKQLLSQAGYNENNKLHLELWYTPTHYGDTEADLAQVIKEQLENTGVIEVTIKSSEWSTYISQLRQGQMMISLLGWYPDYIDPDNFLYPFLHSKANSWTGTGYANSEVDQLLEEAAVKIDQVERAQMYQQVQNILADDCPEIPILQGRLIVVTYKSVDGVKIGPVMLMPYWTLYSTGS